MKNNTANDDSISLPSPCPESTAYEECVTEPLQITDDNNESLINNFINNYKTTSTTTSAFNIVKITNKGSFGETRIVRNKHTSKVYAMKVIIKNRLNAKHINKGMKYKKHLLFHYDGTKNRNNKYKQIRIILILGYVLTNSNNKIKDKFYDINGIIDKYIYDPLISNNEFLLKLINTFQDKMNLYLLTEYMGGGDLMHLLMKKDILSECHTRLYIAELASTINYIHTSLDLFIRDLKPQNILIGKDGHIRLKYFDDFYEIFHSENDIHLNKWKQYVQTLSNDCTKFKRPQHERYDTEGIPDYIAIEVFYKNTYDKNVDWWSMGAIMFQCLCGYLPFHGNNALETCRKIACYERYFTVPSDIKITKKSVNLMKSLVCPAHRRINWDKITSHAWFKKIKWENLKSHKPKYVPNFGTEDVENFSDYDDEQEIDESLYRPHDHLESNRIWGYTFSRSFD